MHSEALWFKACIPDANLICAIHIFVIFNKEIHISVARFPLL